jgi:hypothetical protein
LDANAGVGIRIETGRATEPFSGDLVLLERLRRGVKTAIGEKPDQAAVSFR